MIKKKCKYWPCHTKELLEDCTFCYCPLYPCKDVLKGGVWKEVKNKLIWDCSKCYWIHLKDVVKRLGADRQKGR